MEKVALGKYEADQFSGPLTDCLGAQMVIFSGLKIDKLDDLQAMIDRGSIRTIITAGSLAMALKKASVELEGKQFDLGLSEDPAHKGQAVLHSARTDRTGKEDDHRRPRKGNRIHFAGRFRAARRQRPPTRSGRAISNSMSVRNRARTTKRKSASSLNRTRTTPSRRSFSTTASSACSKIRDFEEGTKKFISQLKRMKDAGLKVYGRRRRRRHGVGSLREAGLGHLLLHGGRDGPQRPRQRAGSVFNHDDARRGEDGPETARVRRRRPN